MGKGGLFRAFRTKKCLLRMVAALLFLSANPFPLGVGMPQDRVKTEEEKVMRWRKDRDEFFRTHQRSPLTDDQKKRFKKLAYFPFDPQYRFEGRIERQLLHINDPKYYATFPTNKGTSKRYIRYGTFHFALDGKDHVLEIFKSILSDSLFIPFKDLTNGKETYEGGRYVDAEILQGYMMILDFNLSYDPSCSYNDQYICALPPKENALNCEIRAGEKTLRLAKPKP